VLTNKAVLYLKICFHKDRHAICAQGTELNFLLKIISSLAHDEMVRFVFPGWGTLLVSGLSLVYNNLYQFHSQLQYLLKTVFRFKIGPIVGPQGLRPYYLRMGTLCVLALEGLTNNFGVQQPVLVL
jgi:hypothetical protein